ncbi:hypothetical protein BHC44_05700 [Snodgrassella alvi]|nr:hypothetical protein BHC44_05700 [Snodgrassella alvi]
MMMEKRIRAKERDAIIQSLKSGVTPKIGIQHIQVGWVNKLKAMIQDNKHIADSGATFRLIVGNYSSGKTLFMSVVRAITLEQKFVTLYADLFPGRCMHATGGQAKNLYSKLMRRMKNLFICNKLDGITLIIINVIYFT